MTEDTLKDLKEKFEAEKKKLGFSSSFEELDEIFYVKDAIMEKGFVSEEFSRQLCGRIVETYQGWAAYLHSLIMPNPQNLLNMGESKIFNNDEKTKITNLMKIAMEISSRNSWIGLAKDVGEEKNFIDDSVNVWKEKFGEELTEIMKKVNKEWKEEADEEVAE